MINCPKNNHVDCVLPYMHLTVNVDGTISTCCMAVHRLHNLNFGYDKISDIWASAEMNALRTNMENGSETKNCDICYINEKMNITSFRELSNELWDCDDRHHIKITYLDIKLSNHCNLKCRMCASDRSSFHQKEYDEALTLNITPPVVLSCSSHRDEWHDTKMFWDNLKDILPNITDLKLASGEPTIDKFVVGILEYCVAYGFNDNITLKIITNGTTLNNKFIELIAQFRAVKIDVSVDAIGDMGEYIRYPMKWDKVVRNIDELIALPNVIKLGVHTTVQVLNLYYLSELFEWYRTLKHSNKGWWLTQVSRPHNYDIKYLPDELLKNAYDRMVDVPVHDEYSDARDMVLNMLKSHQTGEDKNTTQFFVLNDYFDIMRRQTMEHLFPELYNDLIKYKK